MTKKHWKTENTLFGGVLNPEDAVLCSLHALNSLASHIVNALAHVLKRRGKLGDLNKALMGMWDHSYYRSIGVQINLENRDKVAGGDGIAGFNHVELNGNHSTRFAEATGSVLHWGTCTAQNGQQYTGVVIPDNWIFRTLFEPPVVPPEQGKTGRVHGRDALNDQHIARLLLSFFEMMNVARCEWPSQEMIASYRTSCFTFFLDFFLISHLDHTPHYLHAWCFHSWYWLEKYQTLRMLATDVTEATGKYVKKMIHCTCHAGAAGRSVTAWNDGEKHLIKQRSGMADAQGLGATGRRLRQIRVYELNKSWQQTSQVVGLPTSSSIVLPPAEAGNQPLQEYSYIQPKHRLVGRSNKKKTAKLKAAKLGEGQEDQGGRKKVPAHEIEESDVEDYEVDPDDEKEGAEESQVHDEGTEDMEEDEPDDGSDDDEGEAMEESSDDDEGGNYEEDWEASNPQPQKKASIPPPQKKASIPNPKKKAPNPSGTDPQPQKRSKHS
jgi:hypothetical protein